MLGQKVFLESYFPWNFFEKSSVRMIAANFTIRKGSKEMKLAEKFGGVWEEGYYMDEGFGWPVFGGDDCDQHCFEFLKEWRKSK